MDEPTGVVAIGTRTPSTAAFETHCSGTLVASATVLTARHCVDAFTAVDDRQGIVCGQTRFVSTSDVSVVVALSRGADAAAASEWEVARVIRPKGQGDACGSDVALLQLSEPIPEALAQPIAPRVGVALMVGDEFFALGYGPTEWNSAAPIGRLSRSKQAKVACLQGGCSASQEAWLGPDEWIGADTGACHADSGGPALDPQDQLLGIASRGSVDCSLTIYSDVDAWIPWLQAEVRRAQENAGASTPAWTLDEPPLPASAACGMISRGGPIPGWWLLVLVSAAAVRARSRRPRRVSEC